MKDIDIDITNKIRAGCIDDEVMFIEKCVCGKDYGARSRDFKISIFRDDPSVCRGCGRKFYFGYKVAVYEVIEG